jgi:hypothetical protein
MDTLARIHAAIQVAYGILSARFLILLGLMMTFGLFAWAMALGTLIHFAIAAAFGVTIFLPILLNGRQTQHQGDDDGL